MVVGVVLAAGSGTRIGVPKALLRTDQEDESFLRRACAVLREGGTDAVIAVINAECLDEVALPPGVEVAVNHDPARGQLSSLQVALTAVDEAHAECEAAVVLPVDVPLVTAETVARLIGEWRRRRPAVARPSRGARHGHPVVFDRSLFAELLTAPASASAKPIVRRYSTPAGDVAVDDDGAFIDVDTVDDYVRAFQRLPAKAVIR